MKMCHPHLTISGWGAAGGITKLSLRETLVNLHSNAYHYTESVGVFLSTYKPAESIRAPQLRPKPRAGILGSYVP